MSESKFIADFRAARKASVPLVVVETQDPASCMSAIKMSEHADCAMISWDKSEGLRPRTKEGQKELEEKIGADKSDWALTELPKVLRMSTNFSGKKGDVRGTILFIMNGHRWLSPHASDGMEACQALWNLRDEYKKNFRMVVILCPSIELPSELRQDVVVLDHPLPTDDEFKGITKTIYKSASLDEPKDLSSIIDGVRGLSAFSAEQVLAMSIQKDGMDMERLWDKKRKTIEQTPGLRIWRGNEDFNAVKGIPIIKEYLNMVFQGQDPPTVVVFMDEIEKQLGGVGTETSGTSDEMHGQLLSWMVDNKVLGLRMYGHPGCGKSHVSKAVAGQFKKPLVMLNLSDLKSKYVGESTRQTRDALNIISAIGRPIILATCNNEDALSPELKDRFNLGTFFFELPTDEERLIFWNYYKGVYGLKGINPSDEKNWTPRNIKDCCDLAWRLKCDLETASKFIVPVYRSEPQSIENRCRMASGRFLSASKPGVYTWSGNKFSEKEAMRAIDASGKIGEA